MFRRSFALFATTSATLCALACGNGDSNGADASADASTNDVTVDIALDTAPEASPPIVTHPTNILVNGGFEYGLMGFGEFVQPDGNNDYGFFLSSTAAHSGKYAIELRCIGPSCASDSQHRAFIVTNGFHMPPNQPYKLTYWAKCNTGENAFFYTESSSTQYFSKPVSCTSAWAQNEVDFTSSANDGDGTFYFYNNTTGSLFVDDVVLTYADGTVPVHTVNHAGQRNVTVNGTKITVDGKPYLALGFFNVPYDQLAAVAAIKGTNMVTTAGGFGLADLFNTDRMPYPDHAYELGLDVVPNMTETARLGVPEVFPSIMETFAPHLANTLFYLADEPDQNYYQYSLIDPAVMQSEVAAAHTKSALPLLADLQHSHYDPPNVDQPYQISEDVYGSEPYQEDTTGITQTFKVFATMTPRPVWIFDDNHAGVTTVVPKAYYGTILGATGLAYFDWGSLDAANRAADAQAIGELAQLKDVIFAADVSATITETQGVSFIARSSGGKTYVLAVNPTATNVQATFSAPSLSNATVTAMFESRTIAPSGGAFADAFTGISRHVYVW